MRELDEKKNKPKLNDDGMEEVWLGDPKDNPALKEDETERDKYTVYPVIPSGVDWHDFLVKMHWADFDVLNRQPAYWVHARWIVFSFQLETGLLEPVSAW